MNVALVRPHGGRLVNGIVAPERAREIREASREWPSWDLTLRQSCDLELLLSGACSPLAGFLGRTDYESVVERMRLADGTLWPLPIVLDVNEAAARAVEGGRPLALRDPEGAMLAALHVEEAWRPDREREAEAIYGTTRTDHPGVAALLGATGSFYLAGRLEGIATPTHYEFEELRLAPAALRAVLESDGHGRILAFHTRSPLHRPQWVAAREAARTLDAALLIHATVGTAAPDDLDPYSRVRGYLAHRRAHPDPRVRLAVLPLATRCAGPREAIWHAIVRQNFGCSHLLVGPDHAGAGVDASGASFYPPYAAQEALAAVEAELEIRMAPVRRAVFVPRLERFAADDEVAPGEPVLDLPEHEQRRRAIGGLELPDWLAFPEVVAAIRSAHPERARQGFTVFFTGLSGSGKSTIANVLVARLLEMGGRSVSLLDGDLVRKHLSSELGFSKEHRDLNILRIGYVASEITKAGGVAICAPIAPYDAVRRAVRSMVTPQGGFVLVHVDTPLEVCESRDRKGLYAKARAGVIGQFTGISDPYEVPSDAELVVQTTVEGPSEAADRVIGWLREQGYLSREQDRKSP